MARVFLTGATGNVGQPVLAELLRRGFEVTALVRRIVDLKGCRTVVGDLERISSVAREIVNADHIVHLGSPRADERESVVIDDILGTGRLLDLWQNGNFVYNSSSTIYGVPRRSPLTESEPFDAVCWYDLGKVCNEYQLRLTPKGGKRAAAISLRPALIYGAGERRHERQWLSYVYAGCRLNQTFIFDSEEGLNTYGCSYIGDEDFARVVAECLSITEVGIFAFNIAGGFCTWRELIEAFNKYAGTNAGFAIGTGRELGSNECRLPQSKTLLDVSAFSERTGFVPKQSLDELVQRFVEAERSAQTQ